MYKFICNESSPITLEKFLLQLGLTPRIKLKKCIASGLVKINSRPAKRTDLVKVKDEVMLPKDGIYLKNNIQLKPNPNLNCDVLESNENFIVIDKTAGIPSHPQHPDETGSALNFIGSINANALKPLNPEKPLDGGLVHRLDTGTSGILICALNSETLMAFKKNWSLEQSYKIYLALVSGEIKESMTVEIPLTHDPKNKKRMIVASPHRKEKSWPTKTTIKPLKYNQNEGTTLIEVRIFTGVTHQIRATLESLGHPLVGDPIYTKKNHSGITQNGFLLNCHYIKIPELIPNGIYSKKFSKT